MSGKPPTKAEAQAAGKRLLNFLEDQEANALHNWGFKGGSSNRMQSTEARVKDLKLVIAFLDNEGGEP